MVPKNSLIKYPEHLQTFLDYYHPKINFKKKNDQENQE